jgi:hypothetical protein
VTHAGKEGKYTYPTIRSIDSLTHINEVQMRLHDDGNGCIVEVVIAMAMFPSKSTQID